MPIQMYNERFVNREFSWLEFNQRVLDEALDASVPLMERLFFLSISASNLDEFYMVRAGGLQLLQERGVERRDPAGLSPTEELLGIRERVDRMVADQYAAYRMIVEQELPAHGLKRIRIDELLPQQHDYIRRYFNEEIYPVATPAAVGDRFPLIAGLRLHIAVRLQNGSGAKTPRVVLIPLGAKLTRFIPVPSESERPYILLEDVVTHFISDFFQGETVLEATLFRVSRNADMSVNEEWATNLAHEMQSILRARRKSGCVRLEIGADASKTLIRYLQAQLKVRDQETIVCPGPLDLSEFSRICGFEGYKNLRYEDWSPNPSPQVDLGRSMFEQIAKQDIVLSHPYESFQPVIRFIEEAAKDPDVLAIKQILYRTSSDSAVVAALREAAARGKYVTALVELKARFDEARNIEWAKALEEDGIQVIYGVRGLKTHAKICLVVRREGGRIVRYAHFGTGNYNEKTARVYSDVGILTRHDDLGRDASAFFNAIGGYTNPQPYLCIASAPHTLRDRLLECIHGETARSKQGQKAVIMAKMNSLVDPALINALYEASAAGVKIDLCVRGICCLRPGVKKLSENIRVISIIDRFLEHSRIFYFEEGGEQLMFISSADWMPRNLDRRVEIMTPVLDPSVRKKLIETLSACFKDTHKARLILADGTYAKPSQNGRAFRSQEEQYLKAARASDSAIRARVSVLETHRPSTATPKTKKR